MKPAKLGYPRYVSFEIKPERSGPGARVTMDGIRDVAELDLAACAPAWLPSAPEMPAGAVFVTVVPDGAPLYAPRLVQVWTGDPLDGPLGVRGREPR